MIDIKIIILILFIHWIADFVFQTDKMATGKSKNWNDLLQHTGLYSFIWLLFTIFSSAFLHLDARILLFAPITFVCHTATDYYTSRVNSQLWENKEVHNFFVSIGFDQFLHYTQLILTYWLLTR